MFTSEQKRLGLFVFLFSLALVIGNAYNTYSHYDFRTTPDCINYMDMAKGEPCDNPIRKYRVIVPNIVRVVHYPVTMIFGTVWPNKSIDQSLMLSFLLVNSLIMSFFGYVIFLFLRAYKASFLASIIGLTAVLVSRWAGYIAGTPLTDSLYLLIIALALYGIKAKNSYAIIFAILVGPFAKESFIFIAPIIFFFAPEKKIRLILYFILSGLLVFVFRYLVDVHLGSSDYSESLSRMAATFSNIKESVIRIFSPKGIGEMFSVIGIFTFLLLAGFLGGKRNVRAWLTKMDWPCLYMIIAIIFHALLSTEVGRMFYHLAPVLALAIALIIDEHKWFSFLNSKSFVKLK